MADVLTIIFRSPWTFVGTMLLLGMVNHLSLRLIEIVVNVTRCGRCRRPRKYEE